MMAKILRAVSVLSVLAWSAPLAPAQSLNCVPSREAFARGYCAKNHDDRPGIVAARASFDRVSRAVEGELNFESDDICNGSCGKATILLAPVES